MRVLRKINNRYLALPFWLRLPIAAGVIAALLVLTQNPQIFPGAVIGLASSTTRDTATLPPKVTSIFVNTPDNEKLEVWKLPFANSPVVAVIFHGNAADVENFFPYQKYFESLGITSYGVDYRGYGKSSGWPSEKGLQIDSQAVIKFVLEEEQITADKLLIVGISIGTGVASFAATQFPPRALVLFSPFTSLPDAIESVPLFGMLHPLAIYQFPVTSDVSKLQDSCLIVAHGKKDNVIPYQQGFNVSQSAKVAFSKWILAPEASHNDVVFLAGNEIAMAIRECLAT
jgi:alpha/beta superfamily hydrolase